MEPFPIAMLIGTIMGPLFEMYFYFLRSMRSRHRLRTCYG